MFPGKAVVSFSIQIVLYGENEGLGGPEVP